MNSSFMDNISNNKGYLDILHSHHNQNERSATLNDSFNRLINTFNSDEKHFLRGIKSWHSLVTLQALSDPLIINSFQIYCIFSKQC